MAELYLDRLAGGVAGSTGLRLVFPGEPDTTRHVAVKRVLFSKKPPSYKVELGTLGAPLPAAHRGISLPPRDSRLTAATFGVAPSYRVPSKSQ